MKHCILTALFSVLSALLYLLLEPLVSRLLEVGDAKGFMPVAFAMLGVSTTRSRMRRTLLVGCRVPVVLVPWLGLCMAWFVPHSSLLGNLCGLLVGEACILSEWGALRQRGIVVGRRCCGSHCWGALAFPALNPHWFCSCSSDPICVSPHAAPPQCMQRTWSSAGQRSPKVVLGRTVRILQRKQFVHRKGSVWLCQK